MFNFLHVFKKKSETIHLDYASATPVREEVMEVMAPFWNESWANPSAIYASGVKARRSIEEARERLARQLRIKSTGVLFTSGGTESNNLALIGTIEYLHHSGRPYEDMEIVTTKIEHASVLESGEALRARGVRIVYVPLERDGSIQHESFAACLSPKTVLVSIAYVNSEIGTIQDVKRITRMVRAWNKKEGGEIRVHVDAAQAPLWLPCELDMLGADLLSLDAGKCYGPKGMGVLLTRHQGRMLKPTLFGGGQEGGLRSGTENTPLIVGGVEAILIAQREWEKRSERVRAIRDYGLELITKNIDGVVVHGSREARVANNIHISIPGLDAEYAVITLDRYGVAASTKSACGAGDASGSQVVRELTHDERLATSTIRLTLGEETKKEHLLRAVEVLQKHQKAMQAFEAQVRK